MTINSVGSGSAASAVAFQSFEGRLTALLINTEATEQAADRQLLDQARLDFVEETEKEVAAMHAAADATRDGAWSKLAVSAVGLGIQGGALAGQFEALGPSASTTKSLERLDQFGQQVATQGPSIVGDFAEAKAGHDQADARAASYAAKQAQWEIDDRNEAIANSRNDQDKATEWLSQSVSSDAATTNAILSNMA